MIIRIATEQDLNVLIQMMRHYSQHSPITALQTNHNEMYVRRMLGFILRGSGRVWIAERGGLAVGMLVSVLVPNVWNPKVVSLQELAWWVEPEHRHSTAGYRLAQAYIKYANEKRQDGDIDYWTISKMNNSPDMDYTRFGVSKLEETHVCHHQ